MSDWCLTPVANLWITKTDKIICKSECFPFPVKCNKLRNATISAGILGFNQSKFHDEKIKKSNPICILHYESHRKTPENVIPSVSEESPNLVRIRFFASFRMTKIGFSTLSLYTNQVPTNQIKFTTSKNDRSYL